MRILPGATPRARFRILGLALMALAGFTVALLVFGLPAGAPWDRLALVVAILTCVALGLFFNLFACPRCTTYYLWQRYPMHVEMRWMPARCRVCGLASERPYAEVTRLSPQRIAELKQAAAMGRETRGVDP